MEAQQKAYRRTIHLGIVFIALVCFFATTQRMYSQWIQSPGPFNGNITSFASSGTNLFAGTWDGIFLSTNNGITWTKASSGLTNSSVQALTVSGANIFAGTNYGGVYISTNNGTNWNEAKTGLPTVDIMELTSSGKNLFAGTNYGGVFLSTNNGISWSSINTGFHRDPSVYAIVVSGADFFSATDSGVYHSINNGTNWISTSSGLTNNTVLSLAVSGNSLIAGTYKRGLFLSTNNGSSWTSVNTGLPSLFLPYSLIVEGTNFFVGSEFVASHDSGLVFLSTNNGTNWTNVSSGLPKNAILALCIHGSNLFASANGTVWRRPMSEIVTSLEILSTNLPARFSLDQNYPNPFNPTTTISFSIPSESFVSLKIFDVTGREVSSVVSEVLATGNYSRQWNAKEKPSGVYFYRLQARPISGGQAVTFTETKKLVLLR